MKVKDMIAKLQEFDSELTVCLADWQEQYARPNEKAAEEICLVEDGLFTKKLVDSCELVRMDYVCIGGD